MKIKPISFRLYPDGNFLYCEVNIWPTKKAMRAHLPLPRATQASCGAREQYIVHNKKIRKTGLFAEANFYRDNLGIEIVSHEMTHAAFAFADRRRLHLGEAVNKQFTQNNRFNTLPRDGSEERFCYALGKMIRQFVNKCYDLNIYK